jgi:tripartite-type tricarboxylate transporter receptor subunit TctC
MRKLTLFMILFLLLPMTAWGSEGSSMSRVKLDNISLIVPYSAGGGFDTMSRLVSPYLEEYLPGDATVTVKNVPGGNGVIGINRVVMAKPDGETIGIFNIPGFLLGPMLGQGSYDLTEVEWLGQLSQVTFVAAASPKSGVKDLQGLKKLPQVRVGLASLTDTGAVSAAIASDKLGFDIKGIPHKGSTEGILSAIRGDTDFVQYPYGSLRNHLVGSDDLVPLWVYADERLPELPDTPTIAELGYPELLEVISLRRMLGATPGTPPEVVGALRAGLQKVMNDPELLKKMTDGAMEPKFADGERSLQIVRSMKEQMEKYQHLLK